MKQAMCHRIIGWASQECQKHDNQRPLQRGRLALKSAWLDKAFAIKENVPENGNGDRRARTSKMKLSARNSLPGKVVAVTKGSTTAHVKVELAPGLTVTSSITNEAVDDLALKVGDSVSAVIKSSDVMIGK
jgi:molybdopterin-binding protein